MKLGISSWVGVFLAKVDLFSDAKVDLFSDVLIGLWSISLGRGLGPFA